MPSKIFMPCDPLNKVLVEMHISDCLSGLISGNLRRESLHSANFLNHQPQKVLPSHKTNSHQLPMIPSVVCVHTMLQMRVDYLLKAAEYISVLFSCMAAV